jgi:endonuclease/exonuclease/phosphatase (EEP) superfamily protein YafD
MQFPSDVMLWATAATQHAVSWFHLDDHGTATAVYVETGRKFWVVAVPKVGQEDKSFKNFGAASPFTKWEPERAGAEFWDHEGVVLSAGDRM